MISPLSSKWKRNRSKDGYMPCCGKCGEPFEDAETGDVKNYPEDGLVAIFFTCEACGVETVFDYKPYKPNQREV